MENWEIEATKKAYANSTVDEIREARNHAARFPKATETVALLQRILEQRIAQEEDETPAAWSQQGEPKKKKLSAAEEKRREEQRIERETQGGRFLPRAKEPESPYRNQTGSRTLRRTSGNRRSTAPDAGAYWFAAFCGWRFYPSLPSPMSSLVGHLLPPSDF